MKYRRLGRTGLMVSEIGFGAEWMERHSAQECKAVLERAAVKRRIRNGSHPSACKMLAGG